MGPYFGMRRGRPCVFCELIWHRILGAIWHNRQLFAEGAWTSWLIDHLSFLFCLMLNSARLRLRLWREEDLPAFAALNADPEVMEYMPKCLNREESDQAAGRIREGLAQRGFGLWAVEVFGVSEFIGFTGLSVPSFDAHFTPCVEIAWRLARKFWGFGYATEAARLAMDYGFRSVGLDQIVSFTVVENLRSRKVMERLGMTHDPEDDFEHPGLPEAHRLRPHVFYRMNRAAWLREN